MTYIKGRTVFFHSQKCLAAYIQKFHPAIPADMQIPVSVYQRVVSRVAELKAEVLFGAPTDHQVLVDEAVIYELTFILTGREEVTVQERLPPMKMVVRA